MSKSKEVLKRVKRLVFYNNNKMNLKDAEYYLEDLKSAVKILKNFIIDKKMSDSISKKKENIVTTEHLKKANEKMIKS